MGVDHGTRLIAAVDAEAPLADGDTALDRFLAGNFGRLADRDPEGDVRLARAFFTEWSASEENPAQLRAVEAGSNMVEGPDATRVLLGVPVLEVASRDSPDGVDGPASPADIEAAMETVREGLDELGIDAEPELFVIGEEDG